MSNPNKRKLVFSFLCFSLVISSHGQLYFPPNNPQPWETITPNSLGWCQEELDTLIDFLDITNSKAFIVLKDGKIVVEQYFDSFTQDSLWQWASAGKTVTSFLTGMAQQQGFIDINNPTSDYLGAGWTSCTPEQEALITVRNQLTMTTGLDDLSVDVYCTDPECLLYLEDAGNRWAYHNGPYTLLDDVISNSTGQGYNSYFFSQLRNPVGMNGAFVPVGYNNVLFSNARSMARFGLLLQAQGNWNGDQLLTDMSYFNTMITPSQDLNEAYGYLFWLNGQDSFMVPQSQFVFPGTIANNAPDDMYSAIGKDGQILNVIPSLGVVTVRMGLNDGQSLVPVTYNNDIWYYLSQVFCNSNTIEVEETELVNVFPNPSSYVLNVKLNAPAKSVRILDTTGRLCRELLDGDLQIGNNIISMKDLAGGNYIVQIEMQDVVSFRKITKID